MKLHRWSAVRSQAAALVVAVSTLVLAACGSGGSPAAPAGAPKSAPAAAKPAALTVVKVATTRSVADSVVWAMVPFAKKLGLKVEPVVGSNMADTNRDLTQNTVDAAKLGYQNVAIMADQGVTNVKVVAGAYRGAQNLIARTGSGIETWSDLKGKRIGIVQGSYAAIMFLVAAQVHGVNPNSIKLVHVTPVGAPQFAAMKAGQLDGYVIWSPTMEQGILEHVAYRPKGINTGDTAQLGDGTGILAVNNRLLKRPQVLSKFLKAYVQTIKYLNQNKKAWVKVAHEVTGANQAAIAMAVKGDVVLDYHLLRNSLIGAAQYGPRFGYTKRNDSGKVLSYVDLKPLAKVLGVSSQSLLVK